jgi:hypothetical protein
MIAAPLLATVTSTPTNSFSLGSWLTGAGIVISVLIGFISYRLTSTRPKLSWEATTTVLIEQGRSAIPDLDIQYKGTKVQQLAVSRVMIANTGRGTVRRSDLATSLPLQIRTASPKHLLLDAQFIGIRKEALASSNLTVEPVYDNQYALIEFDYLNPSWGGISQVVHTGSMSNDLEVRGDVMGLKPPRRLIPRPVSTDKVISRTTKRLIFWAITDKGSSDIKRATLVDMLWPGIFIVTSLVGTELNLASIRGASDLPAPILRAALSLVVTGFFSAVFYFQVQTRLLERDFFQEPGKRSRR